MRLLVLTNDYPPRVGGIQRYVASLVERFPGAVLVLAPRHPDGRTHEDPRVRRGPTRFLWPTPTVRRWVEAAAADFAPDVVLFGAPFPLAVLGPSLRKTLGVPYAVLTHGAEVSVPAAVPLLRRLVVGPLRRADVVFANSRHTTQVVARLTNRSVRHLGVGVDLDVFRPAARPAGRRRAVIGTVGRFVPRKRQRDVIEAVAALRARGHDVELLIVGRGRLEQRLRRRARRLAVPARFAVDVPSGRLPALYRRMDVFAMPCRSRWLGREAEGLGLVFLEAAASGLPIVVGDSGGAPETVEHAVSGFVVASAEELLAGLEHLIVDRRGAATMGAEGRRRMARDHAWGDVVGRLVAGLEEAVTVCGVAARRRA